MIWKRQAVWVPLFLLAFGVALHGEEKPNVLFIAIDDLRPELGCYGVKEIKTPQIDALAAEGLTFRRAYCQLAVCNPSRVSIMTGLRPDTTKVWNLSTRFRDTIPDAVTLPQHFKQHGYHCVSYGKIFHNPWTDNVSWSENHKWPQNTTRSAESKKRHQAYREKMRREGRPEAKVQRMRGEATEIVDMPDSSQIDGAIADQAIAAMKRLAKQEKPFFLATGFIRPHLPLVAPRKYWELYDAEKIPVASNPMLPKDSPKFAMNTTYELRDYYDFDGTPSPTEGSLTKEQQRRLKHGYYAAVSFVDTQVGRLLSELKAQGLSNNTIVVLWGDHGWKLGEHNSWCKQTNFEIDTRVPLIIRAPGAKGNGAQTEALVESVDVYPTLCELADLPVPKTLEGRSLTPLLAEPTKPWSKAAYSQYWRVNKGVPLMGYSMRTDRYRYTEWRDRRTQEVVASELYDHETDPAENVNIAAKQKALLAELSTHMWTDLPAPPDLKDAPKRLRPEIVFKNTGVAPLTLFWMQPEGGEREVGVIAPGKQLLQNSNYGHQFRLRGPNGYTKIFTVGRQHQTIEIQSRKAIGMPKPKDKPKPDGASLPKSRLPNIVFCMADDWSWPHAGILGDPVVKTPNFDRIAREGVLFENAFVSTPSCTPSRLSILTGQHHWRLKEGDSLGGSLREEFDVYTEMLERAGYRIGRFGKGVWPSKHTFRKRDSFGERFASFDAFLETRSPKEPFCYWHGGQDPHRPYERGVGEKSGIDLAKVVVPKCMPDVELVRSDLADYLWEVQRFDREVGVIIAKLEAMGELENTLFVVSGDNGMPFPRCKATLYDLGTRVPLAVRWGSDIAKGSQAKRKKVAEFVSLCDLAPTFLDAAGVTPSPQMTGRTLLPFLKSEESNEVDPDRSFVLSGVEQHVYSYPKRAIRTADFLYIRNFAPNEWPTGEVEGKNPEYDFRKTPWPTEPGAFSFAIDPSPTKQYLRLRRNDDKVKRFAELALKRPPEEELYDLHIDPQQLHNVADMPKYQATRARLNEQLKTELLKNEDPRANGPW